MRKRYYLAYGSNISLSQMRGRCPGAKAVGTAELTGWELLFKGSGSGAYLTIEEKQGGVVPVAVWDVTGDDEKRLDRYEGCPRFYYKKELEVRMKGLYTGRYRTVTAFVYIMHEERRIGIPSEFYMEVCREGYDDFGFDKRLLEEAKERSIQMVEKGQDIRPAYGKRIQDGFLKGFTIVGGDSNGRY